MGYPHCVNILVPIDEVIGEESEGLRAGERQAQETGGRPLAGEGESEGRWRRETFKPREAPRGGGTRSGQIRSLGEEGLCAARTVAGHAALRAGSA